MEGMEGTEGMETMVVLVTAPSAEVGRAIARGLVAQRLAACVSMGGPMTSVYWWEEAVQEDEEYVLIVKTTRAGFAERFIPAVRALHPYEVPEIIALPVVEGAEDYLAWVAANVEA